MNLADIVNHVRPIHDCNSEAFAEIARNDNDEAKERKREVGRARQKMLYNMRVVVVGADWLGQMVLACLYGLGVGSTYFFDRGERVSRERGRGFLFEPDKCTIERKKSEMVAHALTLVDPISAKKTMAHHGSFSEAEVYRYKPHLIIDATNDPGSKKKVLDYAMSFGSSRIPLISVSSNEHKSAIACYWPQNRRTAAESPDLDALLHCEFSGSSQGGFTSGIAAGLAAEEVRKFAFHYDDSDANLDSNERLIYNLYSTTRKGMQDDLKRNKLQFYRTKNVLVVGAGALGNWVEIYLSNIGLGEVDFLDYDIAEDKNLNRQIELRGRTSHQEKKCRILSERLKEKDRGVHSTYYDGKFCEQLSPKDKQEGVKRITEETILKKEYDALLGCVDNLKARLFMSNFAVKHGMPYIDGGTHAKDGQVAVYIPKITAQVSDQNNLLSGFPKGATEETRGPCQGANPSVVMSNAIVAGFMVGELVHVFDYHVNQKPISGRINYFCDMPLRFYVERRAMNQLVGQ